MELIQDLLHPESDNLHIREDATNGVFVAGAHEVPVTTLEECLHYLELGERNRSFAFTHLNAHSSRSHAVVMVTVVKSQRYVTPQDKASVKRGEKDSSVLSQKVDAQSSVKVGKLYLVDLAGSERLKKSRSVGLRASEAKSINLSLTALGMCISARANDERHIPFRDSKLTRLLQESLGGNAKTTLLVCVADVREHADESLQSLQFGSRAMFVKNKPVVNERVDFRTLHSELLVQMDSQRDRASELEVAVLRTEEERDALHEAMNAEKERLQAVISALREEGEERVAEIQMKAAEELAGVRQVASLEQARRSELEARVQELEKKNANMAEVHYSAVAKLTAQVTDLLSTQASMSASHQRDVQTAAREQQATLHHLQQAQAEVLTLQAANLRMSHQVHKLHAVQKQVLSSLKHLHQAMAGSLSDSGAAMKISSVTSPPAALCSSGGAVGEPGSASPTADGSEAASIPDTPGTPDRRMSACDAQSTTQADAAPRIPSSYELAPPRDSLHCVASALVKTSLNPAYDQQSSCPASPLSGEDGEPLIGRLAPDCTDAQASNTGANSSLGGRRSSMLPRPLGVAAGSFASEGKRRASSTPQRSADSLFQPHPSAYDITSEALVGKCACVCDMMQRVADAMTQLLQSSKEKEAMVQTLQAEAVAASSAHAMAVAELQGKLSTAHTNHAEAVEALCNRHAEISLANEATVAELRAALAAASSTHAAAVVEHQTQLAEANSAHAATVVEMQAALAAANTSHATAVAEHEAQLAAVISTHAAELESALAAANTTYTAAVTVLQAQLDTANSMHAAAAAELQAELAAVQSARAADSNAHAAEASGLQAELAARSEASAAALAEVQARLDAANAAVVASTATAEGLRVQLAANDVAHASAIAALQNQMAQAHHTHMAAITALQAELECSKQAEELAVAQNSALSGELTKQPGEASNGSQYATDRRIDSNTCEHILLAMSSMHADVVQRKDGDIRQLTDQLQAAMEVSANLQAEVGDLQSSLLQRKAQAEEQQAVIVLQEERIQNLMHDCTTLRAQLTDEATARNTAETIMAKAQKQRQELHAIRKDVQRQVAAAITIQTAFRRWKAVKLQQDLAMHRKAKLSLELSIAEADRAARLQSAQSGATMVQDSMNVMREAVEAILTCFVARRKELVERDKLVQRLSSAAPVLARHSSILSRASSMLPGHNSAAHPTPGPLVQSRGRERLTSESGRSSAQRSSVAGNNLHTTLQQARSTASAAQPPLVPMVAAPKKTIS
ncbi:hypothetical protein QJQ45_020736 [Haematococcus lacustris]|nr:hypothetical protein QJQ45_020736 [Haematococcus lacustris]